MFLSRKLLLLPCFLALAACEASYAPTPRPDYVIRVIPTPTGSIAIPPECPDWTTQNANPYDNQPLPQFGCAYARNMADMIDNPDDLVQGRRLDKARGVLAVGAIRRYDNNQTRGLIAPSAEVSQAAVTTAPAAASPLTGDITGAAASSSSGSAAKSE